MVEFFLAPIFQADIFWTHLPLIVLCSLWGVYPSPIPVPRFKMCVITLQNTSFQNKVLLKPGSVMVGARLVKVDGAFHRIYHSVIRSRVLTDTRCGAPF